MNEMFGDLPAQSLMILAQVNMWSFFLT